MSCHSTRQGHHTTIMGLLGKVSFYVGPSLIHYQCYKLICSDTQAVVVLDTVTFRHHKLEIPTLSTGDRIIHCLQALVKAVRANKSPDSTNEQMLAIEILQAIFKPPASINTKSAYQSANEYNPSTTSKGGQSTKYAKGRSDNTSKGDQ